jgi:hypothetical protein
MSWMTGRVVGRRVSARDATWSAVEFLRVLGPFPAVPVEALRHALIALHAQRPTSRFVCRLDRRGGRWLPMPAAAFEQWVDRLIVRGHHGMDADAWARTLSREVLGDRPMVLAAGVRFGGLCASHTVADARVTEALLAELLTAAITGRAATYPFPRPARLPLTRALIHQFGRHPGRVPAAVRIRRLPPPPASGAVRAEWDRTVAYASAVSGPGALARVRRWRDAHTPGVAVSAMLLSAVYAAVRRHLGEPDPAGFAVLVDVRRYLPAGVAVEGNFAWGEHVRPASPEDPASVAAAVTELVESRRTLTMLGLHNLRSVLTRIGAQGLTPPGAADTAGPASPLRPHLTVTYLGRNDSFATLPWMPHEQTRMIGVVSPSGPRGITVAMDELDGALHVTASYHPGVFDAGTVAAAMAEVAHDAVGAVVGNGRRNSRPRRP